MIHPNDSSEERAETGGFGRAVVVGVAMSAIMWTVLIVLIG